MLTSLIDSPWLVDQPHFSMPPPKKTSLWLFIQARTTNAKTRVSFSCLFNSQSISRNEVVLRFGSTNSDECYEASSVADSVLISQRFKRSLDVSATAVFSDVDLWPYYFFFFSMGKRRSPQTAWMLTSPTLTSRSWTPATLTRWTASVSCTGAMSTQTTPLPPYSTALGTQSYSRWEPSSTMTVCKL